MREGNSARGGTTEINFRGLGRHSIQSHDNMSLLVQGLFGRIGPSNDHYGKYAAAANGLVLDGSQSIRKELISHCSRVRATSESNGEHENTVDDVTTLKGMLKV